MSETTATKILEIHEWDCECDNCSLPLGELRERRKALVEASPPTCGGCGGPHRFDTSVPSVLWNRVVRAGGLSDYLCTACVVRAFARAGVSFTAELYGDGFHGETIQVQVGSAESKAVVELNEQNNALRFAITEAARILSEAMDAACRPPEQTA